MSTSSINRFLKSTITAFVVSLFLLLASSPLQAQDLDVPYVPTPDNVVQKMLEVTDVKPSDYVIDLGSGDGRIVIAAAERGANGHGIDLDPERIEEARQNAQDAGVDDQILFIEGNLFETDFSEASVITMYLLPSVNKKLRPELLDRLQPGTRIVSHSFDMGDWKADKKLTIESEGSSRSHDIYYWVIPAKVAGNWNFSADGKDFEINLTQRYQEITASLTDQNGTTYKTEQQLLRGDRITIKASNGNQFYIFSGRVEGDQIHGSMQHHNANEKTFSPWTATRE
ncbi:class I SAM-dependent methyltransferase [Aliifodinibius salicampi]|uniref:Class I SAM-dependent methyltransferase n=1 Tax=Fodinibius salicampi TaxID=1920655 RepID=A0ABT3PV02_9BACT|nr:class I SAM-dependent methyltransferase [Fodinibius salicampi]MCW9711684.1 class I SAM-dependent methyltransferase [Fodinibius salicampi]